MAAASRKLEEEELVEYILTGLGFDFKPITSALLVRKETITVREVYTELLAFETRMELWGSSNSGSSANAGNRGGQGGGNNRGRGANHGHIGGKGRNTNNFISNSRQGGNGGGGGHSCGNRGTSNNSRPRCQVCYKVSHTAERCWH